MFRLISANLVQLWPVSERLSLSALESLNKALDREFSHGSLHLPIVRSVQESNNDFNNKSAAKFSRSSSRLEI